MTQLQRSQTVTPFGRMAVTDNGPSSLELYQSLDALLVSGGDARLELSRPQQRNAYGCVPFPSPECLEFGSSTASVISQYAYTHAARARDKLAYACVVKGVKDAFEHATELTRVTLKRDLSIEKEAEIVFSPSGTDAQLQALFMARAILGTPLTTIIVGADQTGSGTQHTAKGHHFCDGAAGRAGIKKGAAIRGLCENVHSIAIPFCDEHGRLRTGEQLDGTVYHTVEKAIAGGAKVLLQVMDSSKLGWRGPSVESAIGIAAQWPDDVCVVVDACQMRCEREALNEYLANGFLVLITGSKFFTGPAFSGALLIPEKFADKLDGVTDVPHGFRAYGTVFDWPPRWAAIRAAYSRTPNFGQWLRWEAALQEVHAYFAIPQLFREAVLTGFAKGLAGIIKASEHLSLLEEPGYEGANGKEMPLPTIFSFVPHRCDQPMTLVECMALHRAMSRDLSVYLPRDADRGDVRIAARLCQIGQPVALRHQAGAALRISASARLVSRRWARGTGIATHAIAAELADARLVVEKLDWLITHPELLGERS